MTFFCIILIAASALMHAGWNLICKSRHPSAAFFMLSTGASITAMLPLTLYYLPLLGNIPAAVWILVVISGAVQAVYYTSLGNAYRVGEISVAYPLAKAMPVVFVPVVTMVLSLGKQLGGGVLAGMALVGLGCVILPLPSLRPMSPRHYCRQGFSYILCAAVMTTAYTIIDCEALKLFSQSSASSHLVTAVVYIAWENILIEAFLLPYVLLQPRERQTLREMFYGKRLRYPALSGVTCTSSYLLVLLAMMLVSNVSYIAAFRQLSIPLGALLGILLFKERAALPKMVGIGMIFFGLLVIGLCK